MFRIVQSLYIAAVNATSLLISVYENQRIIRKKTSGHLRVNEIQNFLHTVDAAVKHSRQKHFRGHHTKFLQELPAAASRQLVEVISHSRSHVKSVDYEQYCRTSADYSVQTYASVT